MVTDKIAYGQLAKMATTLATKVTGKYGHWQTWPPANMVRQNLPRHWHKWPLKEMVSDKDDQKQIWILEKRQNSIQNPHI